MPEIPVITRFAPSPTGHLHIGGVRTALFCWAYARRHRGRFVLRIEDTDQKRSSEDAARGILEDLAWLGIGWDDGPGLEGLGGDARGVGPYYQAQRLDIYQKYLDRLLEADLAYPAFETAEELAAMRAEAQARKESFCYRQRADYDRQRAHAEMRRREEAGEPFVVRFKTPAEPIRVTDSVLGEIDFDEQHTDDFVIRKADGYPTYHFAVVIDDELMGVTHVLRGQEHLNNTPKHVALQHALTHDDGSPFRTPVYAHMPLIFNADGSKMSKRDKDKIVRKALKTEPEAQARSRTLVGDEVFSAWQKDKTRQLPTDALLTIARDLSLDLPEIDVEDFRRSGYLPGVLCNYLALLGWNPGMKNDDGTDLERFDMAFLCEHFSLERIGKSNAKFDREKLAAFSQATLAAMEPGDFARELRIWCERYDPALLDALGSRFDLAAQAIQPRIKTLSQCREPIGFVLTPDEAIEFDPKAVKKGLHKGDPAGLSVLGDFRERLATIESFEPKVIEAEVKAFCEARELGMGKLAQPLRVAITGSTVSPGLGETLALVGKESALARVDRCLDVCGVAAG
ncbi:Glutamyl-tRNA synthetase @ Glutamyl-tRNA(Gln) synthetase [hydrothermal vent metagenome]|uniref:glutamate--tRNA ligase n=1 Tax=hydrothermal vent metagenome TaxID=652676 RepID=A0A3B1E1K0_9ZZZZ